MSDLLMIEPTTMMQTTDNGWEIQGTFAMVETREHSVDEYCDQLRRLHIIGQGCQAWAGDVYNAMTAHIQSDNKKNEMAIQVSEAAGWEGRTINQYAYIVRNVPVSIRIDTGNRYPDLSFAHFQIVAPLKEDEQTHWLEIAGEKELSAAELRKAIKGLEWEPRYFNHWSAFPIESWQQEYPGQIPGGILQNILYYTTQRGDLVIDAFGGGGNMGKACERMERLCIAYDIDPQFPNITKHNVVFPFPDSGANLVFLDPPYWGQKQGEYATDPADLSNIEDASQFHALLKAVFDNAKQALLPGGYCVLIIGASQTKDYYIDHAAEMYCLVKDEWKHVNSIAAAYPTTQYSGNDMNNAKKNHMMLNLYTTIQIWQKA